MDFSQPKGSYHFPRWPSHSPEIAVENWRLLINIYQVLMKHNQAIEAQ
jgi:hypothetical protein